MTCDLCSQVIKLSIRGSITLISKHSNSKKCRRKAFKVFKSDSKNQNLVSAAIQVMLFYASNQLMSGWWLSNNLQNKSYYLTWKLAYTDLQAVLSSLWESLDTMGSKYIVNQCTVQLILGTFNINDCWISLQSNVTYTPHWFSMGHTVIRSNSCKNGCANSVTPYTYILR